MSRTGHSRDSYEDTKRHRQLVERKYSRIQGLAALLETWETRPEPDTDYIRELKVRLHSAKSQLQAMSGAHDL
jgi:hypothetical protein